MHGIEPCLLLPAQVPRPQNDVLQARNSGDKYKQQQVGCFLLFFSQRQERKKTANCNCCSHWKPLMSCLVH